MHIADVKDFFTLSTRSGQSCSIELICQIFLVIGESANKSFLLVIFIAITTICQRFSAVHSIAVLAHAAVLARHLIAITCSAILPPSAVRCSVLQCNSSALQLIMLPDHLSALMLRSSVHSLKTNGTAATAMLKR